MEENIMYTLSFKKFMEPENFPNDRIELYVIRDGNKVFYVGISKANVWNRWFGGYGRMQKNIYGEWVTHDSISNAVLKNMPKSLKWSVDLWVASECAIFLGSLSKDLMDIENQMIVALLPKINVTGNSKEFEDRYNGYRIKDYISYIKSNRSKIAKRTKTVKKNNVIDIVSLPMEDDTIPF